MYRKNPNGAPRPAKLHAEGDFDQTCQIMKQKTAKASPKRRIASNDLYHIKKGLPESGSPEYTLIYLSASFTGLNQQVLRVRFYLLNFPHGKSPCKILYHFSTISPLSKEIIFSSESSERHRLQYRQ